MNTPATSTTTSWWLTTIARIPLAYSSPMRVAIQATSREHAVSRLRKIYSPDIYGSYMSTCYSLGSKMEQSDDPDDRADARCHPLAV
jgi:hypothetical protein